MLSSDEVYGPFETNQIIKIIQDKFIDQSQVHRSKIAQCSRENCVTVLMRFYEHDMLLKGFVLFMLSCVIYIVLVPHGDI